MSVRAAHECTMLRIQNCAECLGQAYSPPREEGWTRHKKKWCEASFDGADGVVAHRRCHTPLLQQYFASTTPSAALGVATPTFLDAAAPPHEVLTRRGLLPLSEE